MCIGRRAPDESTNQLTNLCAKTVWKLRSLHKRGRNDSELELSTGYSTRQKEAESCPSAKLGVNAIKDEAIISISHVFMPYRDS
ncbi:hypothetical protein V6N13_047897 [Hibiscus sabdariffa]